MTGGGPARPGDWILSVLILVGFALAYLVGGTLEGLL